MMNEAPGRARLEQCVRKLAPRGSGVTWRRGAVQRRVTVESVLPTFTFPYTMQKKRALALQQEWGGKPCDHPAFAKEYDHGERTGSFVCTQCGTIVTFREKAEIIAARGG